MCHFFIEIKRLTLENKNSKNLNNDTKTSELLIRYTDLVLLLSLTITTVTITIIHISTFF